MARVTYAPEGYRIERLMLDARSAHPQVPPSDLSSRIEEGAFVIDIRSPVTRDPEGNIPGAIVIERLVLEWRLDPTSPYKMADGPGYDDDLIIVCNEGFSSTLAARDLRELGFTRCTDLEGGFRAYAAAGLPTASAPTRWVH